MCGPQGFTFLNFLGYQKVYFLPILAHLVWTTVCFLPILVDFSLGKGMLFGDFSQRNVKLR